MKNLLEETKEILSRHNKDFNRDVNWIGCKDFVITFSDFIYLADVLYDDGYGGAEVATDLLVVGDNWWLERHEYDWAEWREYKEPPSCPNTLERISTLTRNEETENVRYSEYNENDYSNSLKHMRSNILKSYEEKHKYEF